MQTQDSLFRSYDPETELPDFRWINLNVPIADVYRSLGGEIVGRFARCWRAEEHSNDDAHASVSFGKNRFYCHVCQGHAMTVIDLVKKRLGVREVQAGEWVGRHFAVPGIPKHAKPKSTTRSLEVKKAGSTLIPKDGLFRLLGGLRGSPLSLGFALVRLGLFEGPVKASYSTLENAGAGAPNLYPKSVLTLTERGVKVERGRGANLYILTTASTPGHPKIPHSDEINCQTYVPSKSVGTSHGKGTLQTAGALRQSPPQKYGRTTKAKASRKRIERNVGISPEIARLLMHGFLILPVAPAGKNALLKDWPSKASCDPDQVCIWCRKYPGCNWGVLCGARSGLLVVDIDGAGGHDLWVTWLAGRELPATLTVKTARGLHIYFRIPAGLVVKTLRVKDAATGKKIGVDVQGENTYVVVPPSIHESGFIYQWVDGRWDTPIAEAPDWLLQRIEGVRDESRQREPLEIPTTEEEITETSE